MGKKDEVIVVGDGPQEEAAAAVHDYCASQGRYFEGPRTGNYGNAQREFGMKRAKGDFIWFVDDDDNIIEGAVKNIVRPALAAAPGRIHVFRWADGPSGRSLNYGDIGGPMMLCPNIPGRLGTWEYFPRLQDFVFIQLTLFKYQQPPIFHNDEVYLIRP